MPSNFELEKSPESPLDSKEIKPVNLKGDQPWTLTGRTDAEAQAQAPIVWLPYMKSQLIGKRLGCWERLRAGREGGDRGWDDRTASPIQWTWTWANSRRWWGTGRLGMPQSMGSQAVRHNLTEQQQILADWLNWLLQPKNPQQSGTSSVTTHFSTWYINDLSSSCLHKCIQLVLWVKISSSERLYYLPSIYLRGASLMDHL